MPTQPDDAQEREIQAVVEACRKAMIDLIVEDKAVVLQELHRWVVAEAATHDPASAPGRTH
jgi:hypothetical protein